MNVDRRSLTKCTLAVALSVSAAATAAEPVEGLPMVEAEARVTAEQRPFTFLADPSTPSAGVFSAGYSIGFSSGISAERPIPVVMQGEGLGHTLSLGYGATGWLEVLGSVTLTNALTGVQPGQSALGVNGLLGAKFQLTNVDSPWRASLMAGGLYEGHSAAPGVWARATGSFSAGGFLAEVNAYVEHVFAAGRDPVDYVAMVGASYRVLPLLRVGAELVGQDLEELNDPGAEDGARIGVGPDVALDLMGGRLQLVAAALFGVTSASPTAIVRAGIAGNF